MKQRRKYSTSYEVTHTHSSVVIYKKKYIYIRFTNRVHIILIITIFDYFLEKCVNDA